ncbi:MAG: Arc family DNA-binding protein [Gemmatimonadetes bacterium]|nr:Arc family DNA-binding protein [Gemmatimonadota bacterium]
MKRRARKGGTVHLTLKNVPGELYERLKRSAARHGRSMNREAILCLQRALGAEPFNPEEFLAAVRAFRVRQRGLYVREPDLRGAREAGRP